MNTFKININNFRVQVNFKTLTLILKYVKFKCILVINNNHKNLTNCNFTTQYTIVTYLIAISPHSTQSLAIILSNSSCTTHTDIFIQITQTNK